MYAVVFVHFKNLDITSETQKLLVFLRKIEELFKSTNKHFDLAILLEDFDKSMRSTEFSREIYSMCEILKGDSKKTEETIKDIDARTINLIQNKFKKNILNFFRNSYEKFLDKNTREKVYSEIMEDWVLVKIN
ncbi:hypothetical protein CWI37_0580p0020 [Hamiltosporidium tvaerminnensis]|uniref:Uncharacterized protein n=1 Tax=Hamiltosporidium tvaerminnensis TaxID=1176355 RepID=A0A4Q9L5W3_9MICR|nr:hypothetical protein LUQ84_000030 [Hamiltosporidium tvaerminnensis]TBT99829.1 hypothetical protein CWI37_1201p0010 [Hamiltosporidium tvaerminnensis]TBU02000.1 hypothetical protein CWI37_0580p0020 [Hamiltosporidium tvaerminnensis]